MNISSVLVNARPEHSGQVQQGLLALSGVEVHAITEEGRMVVTIEADSERALAHLYEAINQQPGVLSTAMVYHQYESDPDLEV